MIKNFFKTICLGLICAACALGASACNPSDSGGKQGKMTEEEWKQAFADSYAAESFTSEISMDGELVHIQKFDTVNDIYIVNGYRMFDDNFSDIDGYKYCSMYDGYFEYYVNEEEYKKERNKILYKKASEFSEISVGLVYVAFYYNACNVVDMSVTTKDNIVGKIIDLYKYFEYDEATGIYSGSFKYGEIEFTISYTFADDKISTFSFVDKDNREIVHSKITDYNCTVATLPPDIVENINTVKDLLSNS